jgi:histidinol phosphatase-like PHP family hydrolase
LERLGVRVGLYLYETHLHTSEASACSIRTGAEQARIYKEIGYTGIIVTDHFFNGNTAIPSNLPWERRVDLFCKGYENAKEEGDKIGLSVFFGWESNYRGTEFLVYGLDHEWMRNHPDMINWSVEEQYYYIHEAGGYVVHAHPFRSRAYIKEIRLFPEFVDAVEAYNEGNGSKDVDKKALAYAKKHNFPALAGTDAHGFEQGYNGMGFKKPLNSIHDFISYVKLGKYKMYTDM